MLLDPAEIECKSPGQIFALNAASRVTAESGESSQWVMHLYGIRIEASKRVND